MKACNIDIINRCNLKCKTCVRGLGLLKTSEHTMPLSMFEKIIDKTKTEGYEHIGIYNWIEPFLCKTMKDYVTIVKNHNLICELSSNLSLPPVAYFDNIAKSLQAGIDQLIVSVSGLQQHIYEINHCGGNIEFVKTNLELISVLKKHNMINTRVILKFLEFDFNKDERINVINFAKTLDIDFNSTIASGDPKLPPEYHSEKYFLDITKHDNGSDKKACPLNNNVLAIDSEGDIYACCTKPNYAFFRIGSYLDMSPEEILIKKTSHPIHQCCARSK